MTYYIPEFDKLQKRQILRLVLDMRLVDHFTYTFFYTYPKIMKLVSFETRLMKVSGEKKLLKREFKHESYVRNKFSITTNRPSKVTTQFIFSHQTYKNPSHQINLEKSPCLCGLNSQETQKPSFPTIINLVSHLNFKYTTRISKNLERMLKVQAFSILS